MAFTANQQQQYMSVQQPWAYLIAHGFKKCENREGNHPKKAIGQFIAIHVTKNRNKKSRHQAYQIPLVQHFLGLLPETQLICRDYHALDEFFDRSTQSIVGVVQLKAIFSRADLDEETEDDLKQQYPFYDVGRQTNCKLLFGDSYVFDEGIPNVKGVLGIRNLTDPVALREVRKCMAEVEYTMSCMIQQQQNDEQMQNEEEKNEMMISEEDDDDDEVQQRDNDEQMQDEAQEHKMQVSEEEDDGDDGDDDDVLSFEHVSKWCSSQMFVTYLSAPALLYTV